MADLQTLLNGFLQQLYAGSLVVGSGLTTPTVQLGGTTSSFVMIKRNGATLEARLADDSNYCAFQALSCLATTLVIAGNGTAPVAGGSATFGLGMSNVANFGVWTGTGAPTFSAAQGSLYLRRDGTTTNDRAYINTNGTTGWTNLTTAG